MYFNKDNNFFHGIMFHHFHDHGIHTKSQGSIDKDTFYKIIKYIGRDNILDADVFFEKFKSNNLNEKDVCFTFDDNIKSQIDVALPILEEKKIKSFFFIYTSIFEGESNYLELFRYFRSNYYNNIDEFYDYFYKNLNKNLNFFFKNNIKKIQEIKIKSPHYSIEDIKFRLVRDLFLNQNQYEEIMFKMIKEKQFNTKDFFKKFFWKKDDLKAVEKLGHLIGLQSHNHPTLLENLNYEDQKYEYTKCQSIISKILDKPKNEIKYMSHPCGSYNNDTLEILEELGIELGFKQIMSIEKEKGMKKINNSFLEIARQNHAHIVESMK